MNGTPTLFYPDDYFTLIPDGNLGKTWYGTTPEESDLMSGATEAQVQIVNTGVAVTTPSRPHPVNVLTIVSEIVLPKFRGDRWGIHREGGSLAGQNQRGHLRGLPLLKAKGE